MAQLTPMMQQYMQTKKEYQDCILFYRLGDFYEMFFEDALTASKELEITLTGKDCGLEERAPMCGVPYHAVDSYLNKLVSKGYKVAICEQVDERNRKAGSHPCRDARYEPEYAGSGRDKKQLSDVHCMHGGPLRRIGGRYHDGGISRHRAGQRAEADG